MRSRRDAIARLDFDQRTLVGANGLPVAVAAAHVGEVDAEHEAESTSLAGGQLAEGVEEAGHPRCAFGRRTGPGPLDERAAEDRHDANVGAVEVLQEHHLELDRVLDGVAVVFQHDGAGRRARQRVDDWNLGGRGAERRSVRFAGQPEAIGLAVVRGAQHDEDAVARIGGKRPVRGGVTGDAALGTDVRGRDGPGRRAECGAGRRRRAIEVAAQGANEDGPLLGVTAAGVSGLAHVARRELALALPAHFGEARVVEKARLVEGGDEPLGGVPHLDLAGETGDGGPQVAFVLLSVETAEAARQQAAESPT